MAKNFITQTSIKRVILSNDIKRLKQEIFVNDILYTNDYIGSLLYNKSEMNKKLQSLISLDYKIMVENDNLNYTKW